MTRWWLAMLLGCGGGSTATPDATATPADAVPDAPPTGGFALTSPMLADHGTFDAANTCSGANTSPALAWSSAPAGALGFAVILTDRSLSPNLVHWIIYDIASTASGLPADVDKQYQPADVVGAHQTESYDTSVHGYLGPCPPELHTYTFDVVALDVAALPGASMTTTRAQAAALIQQHQVAIATLTGTYQP